MSNPITETLDILDDFDDDLLKLISAGHKDINGNTLLMYACDKKREKLALRIIRNGLGKVNKICKLGYTSPIVACWKQLENVALKILDEPNFRVDYVSSTTQETALLVACQFGVEKVALKILKKYMNSEGFAEKEKLSETKIN